MTRGAIAIGSAGALATGLGVAALGQCVPQWSAYPGPRLDDGVNALTAWDPDGPGPTGPLVIAGGNFQHVGASPLKFAGAWDGGAWRPLDTGVSGTVECLGLYDPDGAGPLRPQVVAGGIFGWTGNFQTILNGIARFDGVQWMPFGSGVAAPGGFNATVYATTPWGTSLVIGGLFLSAGSVSVSGLARWDGAAWSAFTDEGAAAPDSLSSLGGALYAGGRWHVPGAPITEYTGIFRFDNQTWVTVGQNYPDDEVFALATYRGQLVAGGRFHNGGNAFIARFDGTSWQPLGSGLNFLVYALCVFDPDGPGPVPDLLIAGGSFSMAGGQPASCIAAWDGAQWMPLGPGTSGTVRALTVWNNTLVAGGDFYTAGGLVSPGMAFWGCPSLPCYPNCDSSTTAPILNIADFACFLNRFFAGDTWANCDNSTAAPVLNVSDFACFLNQFAAGCP
jgi:hypothetical protein